MLLGGLWHGASLKFVFWGGLHGFALAVHKLISETKITMALSPVARKLGTMGGVFITFHFVCFCWIFFRATSMEASGQMINQIIQNFRPELFFDFLMGYKGVIGLMIMGYTLHLLPKKIEWEVQDQVTKAPLLAKAAFLTMIILIVVQVKSAGIQPFIYFQF